MRYPYDDGLALISADLLASVVDETVSPHLSPDSSGTALGGRMPDSTASTICRSMAPPSPSGQPTTRYSLAFMRRGRLIWYKMLLNFRRPRPPWAPLQAFMVSAGGQLAGIIPHHAAGRHGITQAGIELFGY